MSIALAWLVHLYTASGAVLGLFTLYWIEQFHFQTAFWLMSLAVVVDATDGTLARIAGVKEKIPWFDGDRLEDIVDYLNYVFVPCILVVEAKLLPEDSALWWVSLPLLASAYGFSQREAKTMDHFFLGFPSYWNIVAFYLYLLKFSVFLNALILAFLSFLVFVPVRYLYPSRSEVLRGLTLGLGILWGIAVLVSISLMPQPPEVLVLVSLVFPAYYMLLSFGLEIRRRFLPVSG